MAQLSISLESSSPPLKLLPCLTHPTVYPTSELTCRLSDLLHPGLPSRTATSLMVYRLLPMFSFGMLFANLFNHPTMDRTESSKGPINTLQSPSMVVTIPFPLIASNSLISIPTTSKLHPQPCRTTHSGQHVHFSIYLSQHVSYDTGEEWCSELNF